MIIHLHGDRLCGDRPMVGRRQWTDLTRRRLIDAFRAFESLEKYVSQSDLWCRLAFRHPSAALSDYSVSIGGTAGVGSKNIHNGWPAQKDGPDTGESCEE